MPFTPAHIAAVLPLRRRWNFIFSALIIGSVAPDFEYFLTLGPHTQRLHTFPGVLLYTLPGAFAFFWVLQRFIKEPVLEFLPTGIAERMDGESFRFRSLAHVALIFLSLAIGIATHLAWDAFTHENTMVTDRLAIEHSNVPLPVVGPKKLYKVLQWGSSIAGVLIVAVYFYVWYSRTNPKRHLRPAHSARAKIALWTILTLTSACFGIWHDYVRYDGHIPANRDAVVIAIVSGMAIFFWGCLAFSVLVQARRQWMMKQ